MTMPKPPNRCGASGKRLWRSVLADYDLDEHELTLLRQAARIADACDDLQAIVDAKGPLAEVRGILRAHPALVELRQQRITLARLIVALRVPLGEEEAREDSGRPGCSDARSEASTASRAVRREAPPACGSARAVARAPA